MKVDVATHEMSRPNNPLESRFRITAEVESTLTIEQRGRPSQIDIDRDTARSRLVLCVMPEQSQTQHSLQTARQAFASADNNDTSGRIGTRRLRSNGPLAHLRLVDAAHDPDGRLRETY